MITYSNPFFKDGKVWGVSTIDISLYKITELIKDIQVGETGFAFLIDKDGTFLTLRRDEKELKKTIFDSAKEYNSSELEDLGKKMISGKEGFVSLMNPLLGKRSWIVYGPIRTTGWSLAIVFPEDELLMPVFDLHRKVIFMAVAGLLLLGIIISFISYRISRPIGALAEDAERISLGDFNSKIRVSGSRDEIGTLTRTFEKMKSSVLNALEQLKEEKEIFSMAFSKMSDGLVILDAGCNVIQANEAAKRLLMFPVQGSLRDHIAAHFDGDLPFAGQESCGSSDASFKITRRETGDVGPLHLGCTVSAVTDDAGRLKEHILTIRNITEQEKEDLSKRSFLSLMSHKLFTPVTALQGKLMLLKDGLVGKMDEKQIKVVNSMAEQTTKLNDLIGDLMSFVSLEETKLDTARERLDIKAEIEAVAEECKGWFSERLPEVSVDVRSGAESISFNRRYFDIVIKQLIDNGLKFNLSAPPKVDIECEKEGNFITLRFKDNGVGIPPEYFDRIFDKFFQIEKYYTGNVEGAGLGLAYVKKIVETFGGRVDVSSEIGKGSVFTVRIPA